MNRRDLAFVLVPWMALVLVFVGFLAQGQTESEIVGTLSHFKVHKWECYPNLPPPKLVVTGTEDYESGGSAWTRYLMTVANRSAFPDELFAPAPDLPPCGLNPNASRTWVDIYAGDGTRLYGFCALPSADDLDGIWFAVPRGQPPPDCVYITLTDRRCKITYTSNYTSTLTTAPRYVLTRYEGVVGYELIYYEPGCWWKRIDGVVDRGEATFFPEITGRTWQVARLLAAIGCPTTRPTSNREIWRRVLTVWNWLQVNELEPSDANYSPAKAFLAGLGRWPSLADIASMYVAYGGIYWGTCMSRAQLFATLLYAVGLPPDRFAIAETRTATGPGPGGYQHMYVILYLKGRWIYLDPTCISLALPDFERMFSLGCIDRADYVHPLRVVTLPDSRLDGVPLVQ